MPFVIYVFTISAFALGLAEFVPIELTDVMAQGLCVGVEQTGAAVTTYALGATFAAPVLSALTASWSRKNVMLTTAVVFTAGSLAAAFAATLPQLLLARFIAGLGHGLFLAAASSTAARLAGPGNCPDCGAVMGDATYQETFDEESQVEAKENDPEEMEGAEHPHNENAGSDPHRDCSDETGEVADPVIVEDIEPGIYYGISNENYHAGPGISKSQLDDIADTPALYLWRKNAPVDTTKTKTLDLGTAFHCRVLEPEEFSNRFIVAPEFNRRTNAGKEEEKAFLMECASTGKTVITAEEGRKIELMYQSVMALPLGQWLVESAGHAESSIYWEDPETGILCRCRPDKIIPEFHWIMDVKTTADIQRFKTAYYDYRYHVQDAFYSDGYEAQFGVQPTFVFLVASTTIECGRYPVEIFMMGEEAKLAGQQEYHRNLRTLSDCLNTDEWPAIKTLSLPRWAKEYAND